MEERKIPNDTLTLANKSFSDILYSYLQIISNEPAADGRRYIRKKDINTKEVCNLLGVQTRSYQDKLKKLKELNYISEEQGMIFINTDGPTYFKIPKETLNEMIIISNKNVIKVYLILGNMYEAHFDPQFSLEYIAKGLGYANAKYKGVRDMIETILKGLVLLGLIEYENLVLYDNGKGIPVKMKRLIRVNKNIQEVPIRTLEIYS